jgi:hypothetical protein
MLPLSKFKILNPSAARMIFVEGYRRRWNADLCVWCAAGFLPGLRHQKVPMEHLRGWSKKRRHVRGNVMIFFIFR